MIEERNGDKVCTSKFQTSRRSVHAPYLADSVVAPWDPTTPFRARNVIRKLKGSDDDSSNLSELVRFGGIVHLVSNLLSSTNENNERLEERSWTHSLHLTNRAFLSQGLTIT